MLPSPTGNDPVFQVSGSALKVPTVRLKLLLGAISLPSKAASFADTSGIKAGRQFEPGLTVGFLECSSEFRQVSQQPHPQSREEFSNSCSLGYSRGFLLNSLRLNRNFRPQTTKGLLNAAIMWEFRVIHER
jgi:hypothetical protein